jgi:hypothetical protein
MWDPLVSGCLPLSFLLPPDAGGILLSFPQPIRFDLRISLLSITGDAWEL